MIINWCMTFYKGNTHFLHGIPNFKKQLSPSTIHTAHTLWEGTLLLSERIRGEGPLASGWICNECHRSLIADRLPKLALANNMWIGPVPPQLAMLTLPEELLISRHFPRCYVVKLHPRLNRGVNPSHLQRGMAGNVTLYDMNTNDVIKMLEGQLLPQPVISLASVLAITYLGTQKLPKNWLKNTFRVRQFVVHDALIWLKANNPLYGDINIANELLDQLPEDDVPDEITSIIRHVSNDDIASREAEGYVPNGELDEGKVDEII